MPATNISESKTDSHERSELRAVKYHSSCQQAIGFILENTEANMAKNTAGRKRATAKFLGCRLAPSEPGQAIVAVVSYY